MQATNRMTSQLYLCSQIRIPLQMFARSMFSTVHRILYYVQYHKLKFQRNIVLSVNRLPFQGNFAFPINLSTSGFHCSSTCSHQKSCLSDFFLLIFYFDIISDLQKSSMSSAKNPHLPFISQMLTFATLAHSCSPVLALSCGRHNNFVPKHFSV